MTEEERYDESTWKEGHYSLHVIGVVGGVGVQVLRHRADLPLLHNVFVGGAFLCVWRFFKVGSGLGKVGR